MKKMCKSYNTERESMHIIFKLREGRYPIAQTQVNWQLTHGLFAILGLSTSPFSNSEIPLRLGLNPFNKAASSIMRSHANSRPHSNACESI